MISKASTVETNRKSSFTSCALKIACLLISLPAGLSFLTLLNPRVPLRSRQWIAGSNVCPSISAGHVVSWPRTSTNRSPIMSGSEDDSISKLENEVLDVLTAVIDPDLGQDIVSLGFVKNLHIRPLSESVGRSVVTFNVELTTPACPVKEAFQTECRDLVEGIPWVDSAVVNMTAQPMRSVSESIPTGLSKVANIVAVSSCKGGVGKSTTAVNLAYALRNQGARVGLLDADIYGPSLPTMVKPASDVVEFVGSQIRPLESEGVKLMSYGFVNQGAAIMRGPMVSQLLQQFVTLTSWGELDYLIIDMPPGTGDVQLTLCQVLNITAAVIVTTPQKLSFTDVVKGIDLFDTVNVPSVAVVENMAFFETRGGEKLLDGLEDQVKSILRQDREALNTQAANDGVADGKSDDITLRASVISRMVNERMDASRERHYVFGNGHRRRLADMWGITNTVQVPILTELASSGDKGTPYVHADPDGPHAQIFGSLAESVVREVAKLRFSASKRPTISFQPDEHTITIETNGKTQMMTSAQLRRQCRCALCVEEFSGRPLLDPASVREDISPSDFVPVGNYAVSVQWSDGHTSLYPYSAFARDYEPIMRRLEAV